MARFLKAGEQDLDIVVSLLCAGELVALPTETVYGLAGNALREESVRRVFEVKSRPFIDPLIVHLADYEQVEEIACVPAVLEQLAESFWPGPLTVVLKKKEIVPDLVTAGLSSVAIRMPAHSFIRRVLQRSKLFLAAPSANPFGYLSPTCAEHVRDSLGGQIEHIVNGGECVHGIESTVLDLQDPRNPVLLRPGPVDQQRLEAVLGRLVQGRATKLCASMSEAVPSPGLLKQHYSPRTPMHLLPSGIMDLPEYAKGPVAMIQFKRQSDRVIPSNMQSFCLTEDGDLCVAARNLFALMRRLDGDGYALLLVEEAPPGGLGDAINDRLRRGAGV